VPGAGRTGAGVRGRRARHLQCGRHQDRVDGVRPDPGHPPPQPGRRRARLGRRAPGGRPSRAAGHRGLLRCARSHPARHPDRARAKLVTLNDPELRDRALLLRRWGRRSELLLFGSRKGEKARGGRRFWEDLDGIEYDNTFIFDELGWNFEPSELGAAFGLVQLDKLEANYKRRIDTFTAYAGALARHPGAYLPPRQLEGLHTAWLSFPFLVHPEAGFSRADLQSTLEPLGIDTRTVWTGNAVRQPLMRGVPHRQPEEGLPNADAVMARGVLVSNSHGLTDEAVGYVVDNLEAFAVARGH
jgi:CDP-6-deoxy-D-xylo-4-hexulose-3-dehydrase